MRVAIQFKELISSNVTSVMDGASNPAKLLRNLQREIEEAIIVLHGERTLATQRKARLEGQMTQTELRDADWSDKARTAMEHGREDLARQALLAREDCRSAIVTIKDDLAATSNDIKEIAGAIADLEAKRDETRDRAREQAAADSEYAPAGTRGTSKADHYRGRIAEMEKRTDFATEDTAPQRAHSSVDMEIEEMRRARAIDAELAAMRQPSAKKSPAGKASSKKG